MPQWHFPPRLGVLCLPKWGRMTPLTASAPALRVLCPEPPSHPDGLCYLMAAAAAPTAGWGDGMG